MVVMVNDMKWMMTILFIEVFTERFFFRRYEYEQEQYGDTV